MQAVLEGHEARAVEAVAGQQVPDAVPDDETEAADIRRLAGTLAEDEVQLITFTGVRGFFRRSSSVIVRFTRPSSK